MSESLRPDPSISIAISLFNEEETVEELLLRVTETLGRLPEHELMSGDGFQYLCGNFLDLFGDLGVFVVVLALDAVENFADESEVLHAMYTNTRPGGIAIVTVPAHPLLWSSHDDENCHFRRYARKRLITAMSDVGFTIERVGHLFGVLMLPKALITIFEKARSRPLNVASMPSMVVNRLAGSYFRLETDLASGFRNFLPFGTSVLVIAHRPNRKSEPVSGLCR